MEYFVQEAVREKCLFSHSLLVKVLCVRQWSYTKEMVIDTEKITEKRYGKNSD